MASFRDIIQNPGDVFAADNPFIYTKVGGRAGWKSSKTLDLYDNDPPFGWGESGKVYLVVKPGYEVDLQIGTQNSGFFGEGEVSQEVIAGHNMDFNSPIISEADWAASSLNVTLRGYGMLAINVDGEGGAWDKSGTTFDTEWKSRGGANPGAFSNGMLLSLTMPYGDQSDSNTHTLTWNDPDDECRVTMLEYRKIDFQAGAIADDTSGVGPEGASDSQSTGNPIKSETYATLTKIYSGTDEQGRPWIIEIGERVDNGRHDVIVDGTISSSHDDYSDAVAVAKIQKARRIEEGKISDPEKANFDWRTYLAVGGGFTILIIVVVAGIYLSSTLKGLSALKGGN